MKILITGATGFVGKHLWRSLIPDHELHALIRPSSDVSAIKPRNTYVFTGDIDHLAHYMEEEKIDGIIHLATLYIASHQSSQVKDLIDSNILLGVSILEAAVKAHVKWFINTGTIWQNYNAPDYSDKYCPVNLYAASKQAFMTMARFYTETSDIRFVTLKLCDTYGPDDSRRKIIDLFEENASTHQQLDMSPGRQLIDLAHIDKVVNGYKILINLISDPAIPCLRDEYVVTSGRQITLRQLAREYEKEHGLSLNINWGGRPYREREVMNPYKGHDVSATAKSYPD